MARFAEKQSAIVHFNGFEFRVQAAPPGSEDNAISAAANVASRQGRGDIAARMVNNRSQCYIEWGEVKPTGAKVSVKPKKIEPVTPPREKIVFPTGKITQSEINEKLRQKRRRKKRT